ncbi:MAG: class I SAM-dependent methyltransferase [Candidatus Thorarchaeota archaeon]
MKEVDGVKYYNVSEICGMLHDTLSHDEIEAHFRTNKIHGIQIENQWYAKKEAVEEFEEEVIYKDIYFSELHQIDLKEIQLKERILDIGGGGEGIICQLAGPHVISIDPSERELKEAPSDCVKIIMNGTDLKFLDETFDIVTLFFTMMYISRPDQKKVLKEAYRVLKPKGELLLWDLTIPDRPETEKDTFAIKLEVDIGKKKITTGYGTRFGKKYNMERYLDLGKNVGLKVIEQEVNGETFFIKYQKD